MRTWILKIPGMSSMHVNELVSFAWQYREKKARIAAMRGSTGGSGIDGMPHGKGGIGRPTEQTALRIIDSKDAHDVKIIEESAWEAAGGSEILYANLIASVCDRVPTKSLDLAQGYHQFNDMRRKFYLILDGKR